MRFLDLLDTVPASGPDAQRQWAAEQFLRLVDGSHLAMWSPEAPVPGFGWRLLLGVTPAANREDLVLLDVIESQFASEPWQELTLHVFDVEQWRPSETLTAAFPGLEPPLTPPLLGVWQDGRHVESLCGPAVRLLLLEFLGIRRADYEAALRADGQRRASLLVGSETTFPAKG